MKRVLSVLMIVLLFTASVWLLGQAGGTVSGRIFSSDGRPAAGVSVGVISTSDGATASPAIVASAQTNAYGVYNIRDIPFGQYYIFAGPPNARTYYPGAMNAADARVVRFGQTVVNILAPADFSLGPSGFKVTGRVLGVSNLSFRDGIASRIRLQSRPMIDATFTLDAPISPDGTFAFQKVIPGRYTATIEPNYVGASRETVDVLNKDVGEVAITVPRRVLIPGRITVEDDGPLPVLSMDARGPLISLRLGLASGDAVVNTPLLGNRPAFSITLPEGQYRISLDVQQPSGPQPQRASPLIRSFTYGSVNLLDAIPAIRADDPQELVLQLKFQGTPVKVQGRVVGFEGTSGGAPARVFLSDYSSYVGSLEATVSRDGDFEFPKVFPGRYRVSVSPDVADSISIDVGANDVSGVALTIRSRQEQQRR